MAYALVEQGLEPDRSAVDLRRRVTREAAESVVHRARWAGAAERALVESVYRDQMPASAVAALSRRPVRRVRTELRRAVARLMSARFAFVALHRDQWPPTRRRVATACVLHGLTLRRAAVELKLSLHVVRQQMSAVEALFREHGDRDRAGLSRRVMHSQPRDDGAAQANACPSAPARALERAS